MPRMSRACGREGRSDWLGLYFKGDSQFKKGPPLPPGFVPRAASMPPQKLFFWFLTQLLLLFALFFGDELGVGFSCLSNDNDFGSSVSTLPQGAGVRLLLSGVGLSGAGV